MTEVELGRSAVGPVGQIGQSVLALLVWLFGAFTRLVLRLFRGDAMINVSDEETPVFFDLETTGLDTRVCDVVQLSAVCGARVFSVYVHPRCPITPGASRVTGLTVDGPSLLLRGRPVATVSHTRALGAFIAFLRSVPRPVLVGHNSRRFDGPILCRVLDDFGLLVDLRRTVSGCVDTLSLSRELFELRSYSQASLVQTFLRRPYGAHDASEDARALQDLYTVWRPPPEIVSRHRFTL